MTRGRLLAYTKSPTRRRPLRQSPLALPRDRGGRRIADTRWAENVVSLKARIFSGAAGPLERALAGRRRDAFQLINKESLVAIPVRYDAVPRTGADDPINSVDHPRTNHVGFVDETSSDIMSGRFPTKKRRTTREDKNMKKVMTAAFALSALFAASGKVHAEVNYPWCIMGLFQRTSGC